MFFLGVVEAMVIGGVVSMVSGAAQANIAKKSAKAAKRALKKGDQNALNLAKSFEEEWGIPKIETSQFYSIAEEGFDEFEDATFESTRLRLEGEFGKRKEEVSRQMEAQGMPSSFITSTLAAMEEEHGTALTQASLGATQLRYGLQAEEFARHTAFDRDVAMDPFRIWEARTGSAKDLMAMSFGQTQAIANTELARGQMTNQAIGTVAQGVSSVAGAYAGYKGSMEIAKALA